MVDLRKVHSHAYDELNERIPYFGLRGVEQKGALYYGGTKNEPDLGPYVKSRILLNNNLWDAAAPGLSAYDCSTIFPSRERDMFYCALLQQVSDPKSPYYPLKQFIPVYG